MQRMRSALTVVEVVKVQRSASLARAAARAATEGVRSGAAAEIDDRAAAQVVPDVLAPVAFQLAWRRWGRVGKAGEPGRGRVEEAEGAVGEFSSEQHACSLPGRSASGFHARGMHVSGRDDIVRDPARRKKASRRRMCGGLPRARSTSPRALFGSPSGLNNPLGARQGDWNKARKRPANPVAEFTPGRRYPLWTRAVASSICLAFRWPAFQRRACAGPPRRAAAAPRCPHGWPRLATPSSRVALLTVHSPRPAGWRPAVASRTRHGSSPPGQWRGRRR